VDLNLKKVVRIDMQRAPPKVGHLGSRQPYAVVCTHVRASGDGVQPANRQPAAFTALICSTQTGNLPFNSTIP
jgi:hypothetical protein